MMKNGAATSFNATVAGEDPDWWRGAVIYEVYVRSFRDANGDGIGDLPGVLEKLDYIASLGVDAIWLSPFYKSPQKDFGYDVSDYRSVDPTAGTMEDFMTVLDGAHERGLKLLLDFIPGHTSEDHAWFVESRSSRDNDKAEWYVWADKAADGGPPNNWLSSFGGSTWQWEPRRGQYYYHPFLTCQPTLNLRNPKVIDHLLADMDFWLRLGVDGFRIDAVQTLSHDPDLRSNPPVGSEGGNDLLISGSPESPFNSQVHQFDRAGPDTGAILERMRETARARGGVLIGELADIDTIRAAPEVTQGGRLHAAYDFALVNSGSDFEKTTELLRRRNREVGGGCLFTVLTNHDTMRAVSAHYQNERHREQAQKMLLFMQMTLKGGCIIYQGEELGLPNPELRYEQLQDPWAKAFWPAFEGRDAARTPMSWTAAPHAGFTDGSEPWLLVPEEHRQLSVEAQSRDAGSVLAFLRKFTDWRRGQTVLRRGDEEVEPGDGAPLIIWRRMQGPTTWRIVVNFAEEREFLPLHRSDALVAAPGCVARRTEHGVSLGPLEFAIVQIADEAAAHATCSLPR